MTNFDVPNPQVKEMESSEDEFPLLNFLLSNAQKAKILLMLIDGNAVGEVDFPEGYEEQVDYESPELFIVDVKKELKRLGFFSKDIEYPPDEDCPVRSFQLLYSKSEEKLDNHENAYAQGDVEVGRFYGFPETAVTAFPHDSLNEDDVPEHIKNHSLYQYLPFLLSKSHYREEWDWFIEQLREAKNSFSDLADEFGVPNLN